MRLILVAVALALCACTSKTQFGDCIGAFDEPDPTLKYRTEGWNVAMGIIFVELIIPPIVVIANEMRCPIARKDPATPQAQP